MIRSFREDLGINGLNPGRNKLEILQVNLGKLCNLTCSHCHVEAGPSKTEENADPKLIDDIIEAIERLKPSTLDITGGAPEMNPGFKKLVMAAAARNLQIIDRCNLTIFFETGYEELPEFLAEYNVSIVASLPCYEKENVEKQRGRGVFDPSIKALRRLNELGYGKKTGRELILVYNPVGPHLPPPQHELESAYKHKLHEDYGVVFDRLLTITNMPITRYKKFLEATNAYDDYLTLLKQNFNAQTLEGVMCRNTLSVAWDGSLFDCDFNQAVNLPMKTAQRNIKHFSLTQWYDTAIQWDEHCYGCTAGSGSGCQGAIA